MTERVSEHVDACYCLLLLDIESTLLKHTSRTAKLSNSFRHKYLRICLQSAGLQLYVFIIHM